MRRLVVLTAGRRVPISLTGRPPTVKAYSKAWALLAMSGFRWAGAGGAVTWTFTGMNIWSANLTFILRKVLQQIWKTDF